MSRELFMFLSKDHAEGMKPVLEWAKKSYPKKQGRVIASRLLKEIEGIKDYKQVMLSRPEMNFLNSVDKAFPNGVPGEGTQLSFFKRV